MIKTLKTNNGTFASLGNVVLQAVANVTNQAHVATSTSHFDSVGVLPVHQVQLSIPTLTGGSQPGVVTLRKQSSIQNAASSLMSSQNVVLSYGKNANVIFSPSSRAFSAARLYDPKQSQGFVTTTTKFQPFEQLTGISQRRPEIVMLTNFKPLFVEGIGHALDGYAWVLDQNVASRYMTNEGKFFDAQVCMRKLRFYNAKFLVESLTNRYANINDQVAARKEAFAQAVSSLKDDASFLLNLVRMMESQKSQLDLRHDIHTFDPASVSMQLVDNYFQSQITSVLGAASSWFESSAKAKASSAHRVSKARVLQKPKCSCVDTLKDLGYGANNVDNVYMSTKIWAQLMVELSNALKYHTMQFLELDQSTKAADDNASRVVDPSQDSSVRFFVPSTKMPDLPTINDLIDLQPVATVGTIDTLQSAFQTIYQDVFFKNDEMRIAALANFLSQEYKYSSRLMLPGVQKHLSDGYGYSVADNGNAVVFDAIIGGLGGNVTDFVTRPSRSLMSVAQQQFGDVGVLAFETKYVDGDTGTLTPGGDFFIDQVLSTTGDRFNTANINAFTKLINDIGISFFTTVDLLNLYSDSLSAVDLRSKSFLNSAYNTLSDITDYLVDNNGKTTARVSSDLISSVYAHAATDNRTKVLLFLCTMCRISRTYTQNVPFVSSATHADNTSLFDMLIDMLIDALVNSLPKTQVAAYQLLQRFETAAGNKIVWLSTTGIRSSMKMGTNLTHVVEQFMSNVLLEFRVKTHAVKNDHTVYGGYLDTVVMMVAFDIVTSLIAKYCNQSIVGHDYGVTSFSENTVAFYVLQTMTNNKSSIGNLFQHISTEFGLRKQLLDTVKHTLSTMMSSLEGFSNYLSGKAATDKLGEVAALLGNNPDMIRMLFSEQQIMLLASSVEDLLNANTVVSNTPASSMQQDPDDVGDIKLFNDSSVLKDMQNVLYAYLSTSDLTSTRSVNKRVLTVGIPLGMAQQLKQRVSISDKQVSYHDTRNDIVQVVVYKVDVQNSDIVYKPQRFMFQLSRFPVRYSTVSWLPISQKSMPSIQDVVNAVPTQCFIQSSDSSTTSASSNGIEYASSDVAGSKNIKDARLAFSDSSYDFLSTAQRGEVLKNHVVSQLLETYIAIMTSIDVAEHSYSMIDAPPSIEPDFMKTIVTHAIDRVAKVSSSTTEIMHVSDYGVLSSLASSISRGMPSPAQSSKGFSQKRFPSLSGVANNVAVGSTLRSLNGFAPPTVTLQQQTVSHIEQNLSSLKPSDVSTTVEALRATSSLANSVSSIMNADVLKQLLVNPKQFDRVFNVVVDPGMFEIDYEKTVSTPHGKDALDLMIKNGDIIEASENDLASSAVSDVVTQTVLSARPFNNGVPAPNVNSYRYRDRDKAEGDLYTDKYYVTIETFGEGEV